MTLPPAEKTPIVLIRWTRKALDKKNTVEKICNLMQENKLILLPNQRNNVSVLTATQRTLEQHAEDAMLVKKRRIRGRRSTDETIQDYFSLKKRSKFCLADSSNIARDSEGLFSVHERRHLVLGLLEAISVENKHLLQTLCENPQELGGSTNLRYILQCHGWIDFLTPLHVDDEKQKINNMTWYPLSRIQPPVENIEAYYGPGIAYYFAFLGLLEVWLSKLGIAGLAVYLFRIYRQDTIDEDEYTPFYGLLSFIWSVLLSRFWQRKENELAYEFGTLELTGSPMATLNREDYDLDGGLYSHRRPEFHGELRVSPVTGESELFYSSYQRKIQYIFSTVITSLMLTLAFWVMILSLNLQGYIRPKNHYHPFYFAYFAKLSEEGAFLDASSNWCSLVPVLLHASCILCLNAIYRKVSIKLTDWENHETQTSHDNSLILKRFLFEAFDCYVVLFYLAFYERDVERLRTELVAVFNIDTFRRLSTEVIIPYVSHLFASSEKNVEDIHDLHLDEYEQFDDFMEIMIQLGYVILFASAYPLASLMMTGAIWVEIRTDIYKLTHLCQKPLATERVHGIGVWNRILHVMVWTSCLTNCLLFGFTSDQMMHYLPFFYARDEAGTTFLVNDKGWMAVLVIFGLEHFLLVFGLTLQSLIAPISETLEIKLQKRKYLLSFERLSSRKMD